MEQLEIAQTENRWLAKTLGSLDFFAGLTVNQLEAVLPYIRLYAYPKGSAIFREGQPGDALFLVYQGRVRIWRKGGFLWFKQRIADLGSGKIFGEMALLDCAPRVASAAVLEDSKIFVLLKGDFEFIRNKSPGMEERLGRLVSERKFVLAQLDEK